MLFLSTCIKKELMGHMNMGLPMKAKLTTLRQGFVHHGEFVLELPPPTYQASGATHGLGCMPS